MDHHMKKREAINRINKSYGGAKLHFQNTYFANTNAQKNVWWFDIPLSKLSSVDLAELNLLLYDRSKDDLHHLRVPTAYLRANQSRLVVREEKATISLELSTDETKLFRDVRPTGGSVEFMQFQQR
jgi:hypothetical protein